MRKPASGVNTEYELTIIRLSFIWLHVPYSRCVFSQGKSHLPTSPSGWHLGVADSIFLGLMHKWRGGARVLGYPLQPQELRCLEILGQATMLWDIWSPRTLILLSTTDSLRNPVLTESLSKTKMLSRYSSKKSLFTKGRGTPCYNIILKCHYSHCNSHTDGPKLAHLQHGSS